MTNIGKHRLAERLRSRFAGNPSDLALPFFRPVAHTPGHFHQVNPDLYNLAVFSAAAALLK